MKRLMLSLLLMAVVPMAAQETTIRPGAVWPDDRGIHINAHGGGVLCHDGTYYWYGEHKAERTSAALVGINCYSSTDLTHWTYRGVALPVSDEAGSDLERGCVMERPKVIYCPRTGKFVMWLHLELKGRGYEAARFAVAVADTPTGPFRYLYSRRANAGCYPMEFGPEQRAVLDTLDLAHYKEWWTPTWHDAIAKGLFVKRDLEGGQMSRDMTLYVDDDGRAYHIFSSEDNLTLHLAELSDDFTAHTGRYTRIAPGGHNEAPTLFKHDGTYWMITSGCTGWDPNEARMFSASSIWGPWKQHPNPCRGPKAELTFGGQGTFVLQIPGSGTSPARYIFMADIWRPRHPIDARYVWLPIRFDNGTPVVEWQDEWRPSTILQQP